MKSKLITLYCNTCSKPFSQIPEKGRLSIQCPECSGFNVDIGLRGMSHCKCGWEHPDGKSVSGCPKCHTSFL